jgi:hypothetical protein
MNTYSIETKETYTCRYIIEANSKAEALASFKDGDGEEACEPEFDGILKIGEVVQID